jgi:hypothetical protein
LDYLRSWTLEEVLVVRKRFVFALFAVAIAAVSLAPISAFAVAIGPQVGVTAQAGDDSGTWSMTLPPITSDGYNWALSAPVSIFSSTHPGMLLGTIEGINITADIDPFVTFGFLVTAGAVDTNFTLSSPVVGFATISNGLAFASAAITATEGGPDLDGATVTGLFPGTKAYQAQYNAVSGIFGNLVSPVVTAPGGGSNSGNERLPPVSGRLLIPGSVSDIESQFKFTLTALDSASGTSRFDIVPEPSSIVLVLSGAVAVFFGIRRRRSA